MSLIGQSLQTYLQRHESASFSAYLSELVLAIAKSCQQISERVSGSSLLGLQGEADSHNVQGEKQKKLDIISHELMVTELSTVTSLAGMVSEEHETAIMLDKSPQSDQYLLCFDPLDGSSNIDNNFSVGSIFSILPCPEKRDPIAENNFLQVGRQQLAAGFCVYGPATLLVLTLGRGVQAFTFDKKQEAFILTQDNMRVPETTQEFAINMSNQRFWQAPVKRYIDECLLGVQGVREKDFNMRWNASMVAEVYRILRRGGIFLYPLDRRIQAQGGKLRLLYEANPMSFIIEQAGGLSSTGYQRIMDIIPEQIHQRSAVILGSKQEVARVVDYHKTL